MALDHQIFALIFVTSGVGWLMLQAGVGKNMLEWRRRQRVCPSCGHTIDGRTCSRHSSSAP